jgi:hypothetical protein
MRSLKLKYKYWITFLLVMAVLLVTGLFLIDNELARSVIVNILGTDIFILLISLVFKKIMS